MTVDDFIAFWQGGTGGAERANYVRFLDGLMALLGVAGPPPAERGGLTPDYAYEARVSDAAPDGLASKRGRADLYKRGCFILEAKQSYLPPGQQEPVAAVAEDVPAPVALDLFGQPISGTTPPPRPRPKGRAYDRLMSEALAQARGYAQALPADHGWPPFLIVCDVGRAFELYYDWSGNGRGYAFFPDQAHYRIELDELRDPKVRARLACLWTDPASLDPRRRSVEVTREVTNLLASVSKVLEQEARQRAVAHTPFQLALGVEQTALFLMRVLFCMFAEDVELLPKDSFKSFLRSAVDKSDQYWTRGLEDLWSCMDKADAQYRYWPFGDAVVRYFNGNLFHGATALRLPQEHRRTLLDAAEQDWKAVEPAIFGAFLEQALTESERGRLGAHYTPRAYVERLVDATMMELLNAQWAAVRDAEPPSLAAAQEFHDRLCGLRILDPACGTGNFLYVALESLMRLETEVLEQIRQLGGTATPRVDPSQFLGLEINPRAAVIAELVLWIGWLRFRLANDPGWRREPVLEAFANINGGVHGGVDALLAADPRTQVVDLAAPLPAPWPDADFIVGNPPFIGGKDLRDRLGADYAEALWRACPAVPRSADLVMQWWHRAALALTRPGARLRRFGFVTTNSITQTFSRRVIAAHLAAADTSDPSPLAGGTGSGQGVMDAPSPLAGEGGAAAPRRERGENGGPAPSTDAADGPPPRPSPARGEGDAGDAGLSLVLAIPNHPWTKVGADAAAVRIAMTVAQAGTQDGRLVEIVGEAGLDTDTPVLETRVRRGRINADLSIGTDVTAILALGANAGVCSRGVQLMGAGFIVSPQQAQHLGLGRRAGLEAHIRPYRNGRDLLQRSRNAMVIDLYGLAETQVRQRFPEVYQHLLTSVKPERDANRRAGYRDNWWIFGEPRSELRAALAGLRRFIVTVETAKHRIFEFMDAAVLPDNKLMVIASDCAFIFGVLNSTSHCHWTLVSGGWLGVGNDSVYVKSRVFDPFPFPDASDTHRGAIAAIAEELELTRRVALDENPGLGMTGLYNLVEAVRGGTPGGAREAEATRARARIVARLHDQLDAAVAAAYGWPADLDAAEIVRRLVALNAERAVEEAGGHIRWLRPDYQPARFGREAP